MTVLTREHGSRTADSGVSLQTILDEARLGPAEWMSGSPPDSITISWALPLSELVGFSDDLTGVLVHAGRTPVTAEVVRELIQRGVEAFVVSGAVSPSVADAAAGRLAIITCEIDFPLLNRLVAEKVLAQHAHVLEYASRVHRSLSDLLHPGVGLAAITLRMSRLAHRPVCLLDTRFDVLTCESHDNAEVPPPEVVADALRVALADAPLEAGNSSHGTSASVSLDVDGRQSAAVVCPIFLGGANYGWVCILEMTKTALGHDVARHRVIAEHGAAILGSEMLRLHSVYEAEERTRGDFVHALLHGRFSSVREMRERAAHHSLDTGAMYGVVVVKFPLDSDSGAAEQRSGAIRWVRNHSPKLGAERQTLATVVGDLLVIIHRLSATLPHEVMQATAELRAFAHALHRDLREATDGSLRVAFGHPSHGANGIPAGYRSARIALEVGQRLNVEGVSGYSELRVSATLHKLALSAEGVDFASELLGALRRETESGGDLERVVTAYIERGGNINAAADDLQMHRNTVRYKLTRASRLLCMDLRHAESQFAVRLAQRLDLLKSVEDGVGEEFVGRSHS